MNRDEFLKRLDSGLSTLSQDDKAGIIDYYREIIEDKIEAGLCEAGAVESVGTVEEIVKQAILDSEETEDNKKAKEETEEKAKVSKLDKRWLITLIAGAPLWITLLLTAVTVILAAYVCAWVGVASVVITEASLALSAPYGVIAALIVIFTGDVALGFLALGSTLCVAGIAIVAFIPCVKLLKLSVKATKKSVLGLYKMVTGGKLL